LSGVFERKAWAITVRKTSKTDEQDWGEPIELVAFGRALAKYRADYEARTGRPLEVPRNSGKRRTASKKALLRAIAATGKKW
jgi:hypothetical protein